MTKQSETHCPQDTTVKITTSLALIQGLCDQLLTHYHQLSPQEAIDLIEIIELQIYQIQEHFAQLAGRPVADPIPEYGSRPGR